MTERDKGGRPPFEPTAAQRRQVAISAGGGMSHEDIALALGIARNTLEKHFQGELSVGASKKRLEVLNALYRGAMKGNVAAAKAYLANEPRVAAPPPKPEPIGKKQQAEVEARTAADGTEWGSLLRRTPTTPTQ